ncbi:hypothetical protein Tco_1080703 [Tanacetum coccineum]|uniref:Uncharacterized protein n=1 Tax=Tanacetum coccineum TaxID=301880 RepID=A0ABQ5HVF5_9ASTR
MRQIGSETMDGNILGWMAGGGARRSMTWRQFILALGLHTAKEMSEDGFGAYWLGSERVIPDKGDLNDYWVEISSDGTFRVTPKKVNATDLFYLRSIDRRAANVPYLLAQYWFRHAEGRKSDARLSGGHFIRRIPHHFGLVNDDELRGLFVVTREIPLINMGELVKLNICMKIGDNWAWVAPGLKMQPDTMAGALGATEDALAVDEGAQADPTPIQAPQLPPPPPTAGRTMP